jgi:hypothetical protein
MNKIHRLRTQAERLYIAMRMRPFGLTYAELQRLGVSTAPHKRIAEGVHYLKPGERIARKIGNDGLIRIYITRSKA